MRKIAVIIYGPPGSGKGTQANLLADKLGLIHFDTGKFLESVVHDPARQKEKIVQRERRLYDSGKLMTPNFVLREVKKGTERIGAAGWGLVFSGSPRTVYEAEGLMPVLERIYGKKRIFFLELRLPAAASINRNSKRLVCSVCGYTLLAAYYPPVRPKHCPVCAGLFHKRTDDSPKVIKVRLEEYKNRTKPIFKIVKKRGYKIRVIDGRPAPYKVFGKIYGYLKNAR
jgi:adenylate kinase